MSETKTPTSGSVVQKEGGTQGALTILLHPLVIIHISDHWIRAKVQNNKENPRVIGALLGVQNGRNVEIFNSFELVFDVVDNVPVIEPKYLHTKLEQFKKVFPLYDFLGWYSTGQGVQPTDIEVHKQLMEMNESPLYLQLDPSAATKVEQKELPVSLFESELHMVQDKPTLLFVKAAYKIETQEGERISVDHVAKVSSTGGPTAGSQLSKHLMGIHNATTMLNSRIKILAKFLEETKNGTVAPDHGLLRRISSLTSQLPATNTQNFKQEFLREYNDTLLITYLASITKGNNAINDLIDKFNVTYERHSRRRGFF